MFYTEGGEALARVAQRGGGCPIPGNVQGQAGRGSEQPGPVEDGPAHGRGGMGWPLKASSHPNCSVVLGSANPSLSLPFRKLVRPIQAMPSP